jgi:hypothetical protein
MSAIPRLTRAVPVCGLELTSAGLALLLTVVLAVLTGLADTWVPHLKMDD